MQGSTTYFPPLNAKSKVLRQHFKLGKVGVGSGHGLSLYHIIVVSFVSFCQPSRAYMNIACRLVCQFCQNCQSEWPSKGLKPTKFIKDKKISSVIRFLWPKQ